MPSPEIIQFGTVVFLTVQNIAYEAAKKDHHKLYNHLFFLFEQHVLNIQFFGCVLRSSQSFIEHLITLTSHKTKIFRSCMVFKNMKTHINNRMNKPGERHHLLSLIHYCFLIICIHQETIHLPPKRWETLVFNVRFYTISEQA